LPIVARLNNKAWCAMGKRELIGSLAALLSLARSCALWRWFADAVRNQSDQQGGLQQALAHMDEQLSRSEQLHQLILRDSDQDIQTRRDPATGSSFITSREIT
jgi:hypothetical protein